MTDVKMTPKSDVVWQAKYVGNGVLCSSPEFEQFDPEIKRLVNDESFNGYGFVDLEALGLEKLGEGEQGSVYGVGGYAIKLFNSKNRYGRGQYGNYDRQRSIDQTRLAVGLSAGLGASVLKPRIKAPTHYACYEEVNARTTLRRNIQIMDRVKEDKDSPEVASEDVVNMVKRHTIKALQRSGFNHKSVYWYDLQKNILMSDGVAIVTDLLPIDAFARRYGRPYSLNRIQ